MALKLAPITPVGGCLVAFSSALVVDAVMALWVRSVADGLAINAALLSMVCAVASILGLGQAFRGFWQAASWVLGYGLGSWLAVTFGR